MLPLHCFCQQYAWGKRGKQSAVAQLLQNTSGFALHEDEPYAEFWMGTHPNCPSRLPNGGKEAPLLAEWVKENTKSVGDSLLQRWPEVLENGQLPYLFKVLSIQNALSIQAHPDKNLARNLHKEKRQHYPDNNHKPVIENGHISVYLIPPSIQT